MPSKSGCEPLPHDKPTQVGWGEGQAFGRCMQDVDSVSGCRQSLVVITVLRDMEEGQSLAAAAPSPCLVATHPPASLAQRGHSTRLLLSAKSSYRIVGTAASAFYYLRGSILHFL